jgi:hypothetical protein
MSRTWQEPWGAEGDEPAVGGCPRRRGNGSHRWEVKLAVNHFRPPAALLITSAMLPRLAIFAGGRPQSGA